MYCTYFGFRVAPFRNVPQAESFFYGGQRGPILEALMHGLEHGDGILKLIGERGIGCTTLCQMIQSRLAGRTACAYLPDPCLTPPQAMSAIAREFGVTGSSGDDHAGARVQAFLRAGMQAARHVVILVDDAQWMPSATLDAIRLLSNLDTSSQKAARLVLAGTPELDTRLGRHELRQLRDRVTFSARLSPLSPDETSDYLTLRVRTAGSTAGSLFPSAVARQIGRATGGLPRGINTAADRVLMCAFADDTRDIEVRHARRALDELGLMPRSVFARLRQRLPLRTQLPSALPAGAR